MAIDPQTKMLVDAIDTAIADAPFDLVMTGLEYALAKLIAKETADPAFRDYAVQIVSRHVAEFLRTDIWI